GELKRVAGVDLTRIDGIKKITVQTIVTEAGLDMSKWPTEDHFVSWIGFAPRNEISSGRVLKKKTRQVKSRLAGALRMAASTLRESKVISAHNSGVCEPGWETPRPLPRWGRSWRDWCTGCLSTDRNTWTKHRLIRREISPTATQAAGEKGR